MLSTTGRRLRAGVTAAVIAALVAGTLWGEDDHFPFGPFRMYAVTTESDGPVSSLRLEAVTKSGRERVVRLARLGLRRAELQGQLVRFWAGREEVLMRHLVEGYRRFQPDAEPLAELRIVYVTHMLRGGAVVGRAGRRVAATWRAG